MTERAYTRPSLRAAGGALLTILLLTACARELDPASTLAEARTLIEQGKPGEARIQLKKLLAQHADSAEARVLLARVALDNGDARAADSELSGLTPAQLRTPAALATRCWADLGLGRHAQVLETLKKTDVPLAPAEQARLRAAALRAAGAAADGLPALREALVANPADGVLMAELAATLAAVGNLQQAERELDEFLKAHPGSAEALQARGELRLRGGQADAAAADFRAALQAAPAGWPALQRVSAELSLADAALAGGKIDQARAQIQSLEKQFPGALGTQLLTARVALLEGRVGEAVDTLQRLVEAMPQDVRVQYLLADALVRSGNTTRATDVLERRLKAVPDDGVARQLLARLLMQQNRPDRVVELLSDFGEEAGADTSAESLLSAARLAQERASDAITSLEAQLQQRPGDAQLRANLAAAYFLNGQSSRALTVLKQVRSDTPLPAAVAVEMAAHLSMRNDREANLLVDSLLQSDRSSVQTLLASADAAQRAGRHDIVARLLERALQREPDSTGALIRRANLEFTERRYDEAAQTLTAVLQQHPQDFQAQIALARVAEAKGDVAAARTALRKVLQAVPNEMDPALMLAGLELRAGQAAAATGVLDRLVKANKADGVAANAAGLLLVNARQMDAARTRFRQAVDQDGSEPRYWFNLGRAQIALGDGAAAAQSFARTVALRPQWLDANIAAIRLNLQNGQRAQASAMAKQLASRMPSEPRTWLLVGEVAVAEQRMGEAARAFARSYALQPSAIAAVREYHARLASGATRPEQPLLTWLSREPQDLGTRRRLADHYQRADALAAAREQLERIIRQSPNDVGSLNNLAWLLAQSDVARAEQLARRAHAIVPQEPAVADTLGWVLISAGKHAEAVPLLERAAQALPEDHAVRYHLALALARIGEKERARHELRSALAGEVAFSGREAAQQLEQELST